MISLFSIATSQRSKRIEKASKKAFRYVKKYIKTMAKNGKLKGEITISYYVSNLEGIEIEVCKKTCDMVNSYFAGEVTAEDIGFTWNQRIEVTINKI